MIEVDTQALFPSGAALLTQAQALLVPKALEDAAARLPHCQLQTWDRQGNWRSRAALGADEEGSATMRKSPDQVGSSGGAPHTMRAVSEALLKGLDDDTQPAILLAVADPLASLITVVLDGRPTRGGGLVRPLLSRFYRALRRLRAGLPALPSLNITLVGWDRDDQVQARGCRDLQEAYPALLQSMGGEALLVDLRWCWIKATEAGDSSRTASVPGKGDREEGAQGTLLHENLRRVLALHGPGPEWERRSGEIHLPDPEVLTKLEEDLGDLLESPALKDFFAQAEGAPSSPADLTPEVLWALISAVEGARPLTLDLKPCPLMAIAEDASALLLGAQIGVRKWQDDALHGRFAPVTFIASENASGKTSLMEALCQTFTGAPRLRRHVAPGALRWEKDRGGQTGDGFRPEVTQIHTLTQGDASGDPTGGEGSDRPGARFPYLPLFADDVDLTREAEGERALLGLTLLGHAWPGEAPLRGAWDRWVRLIEPRVGRRIVARALSGISSAASHQISFPEALKADLDAYLEALSPLKEAEDKRDRLQKEEPNHPELPELKAKYEQRLKEWIDAESACLATIQTLAQPRNIPTHGFEWRLKGWINTQGEPSELSGVVDPPSDDDRLFVFLGLLKKAKKKWRLHETFPDRLWPLVWPSFIAHYRESVALDWVGEREWMGLMAAAPKDRVADLRRLLLTRLDWAVWSMDECFDDSRESGIFPLIERALFGATEDAAKEFTAFLNPSPLSHDAAEASARSNTAQQVRSGHGARLALFTGLGRGAWPVLGVDELTLGHDLPAATRTLGRILRLRRKADGLRFGRLILSEEKDKEEAKDAWSHRSHIWSDSTASEGGATSPAEARRVTPYNTPPMPVSLPAQVIVASISTAALNGCAAAEGVEVDYALRAHLQSLLSPTMRSALLQTQGAQSPAPWRGSPETPGHGEGHRSFSPWGLALGWDGSWSEEGAQEETSLTKRYEALTKALNALGLEALCPQVDLLLVTQLGPEETRLTLTPRERIRLLDHAMLRWLLRVGLFPLLFDDGDRVFDLAGVATLQLPGVGGEMAPTGPLRLLRLSPYQLWLENLETLMASLGMPLPGEDSAKSQTSSPTQASITQATETAASPQESASSPDSAPAPEAKQVAPPPETPQAPDPSPIVPEESEDGEAPPPSDLDLLRPVIDAWDQEAFMKAASSLARDRSPGLWQVEIWPPSLQDTALGDPLVALIQDAGLLPTKGRRFVFEPHDLMVTYRPEANNPSIHQWTLCVQSHWAARSFPQPPQDPTHNPLESYARALDGIRAPLLRSLISLRLGSLRLSGLDPDTLKLSLWSYSPPTAKDREGVHLAMGANLQDALRPGGGEHPEGLPGWFEDHILTPLRLLQSELSSPFEERFLEIYPRCHLSVALTAGAVFHHQVGVSLKGQQWTGQGYQSVDLDRPPSAPAPPTEAESPLISTPHRGAENQLSGELHLVVSFEEVGQILADYDAWRDGVEEPTARKIPVAKVLALSPREPGPHQPPDAFVAWADLIRRSVIRERQDSLQPLRIFLRGPVTFALALGRVLNAMGRIVLMEHDKERQRYVEIARLN